MSEKVAWILAGAGIAGVAILAYILLTRRAYAAPAPTYPQPPTQPSPPTTPPITPPVIPPYQPEVKVEILDYEVY